MGKNKSKKSAGRKSGPFTVMHHLAALQRTPDVRADAEADMAAASDSMPAIPSSRVASSGSSSGGELKRPRPADEDDEPWEVVDRNAKKRKKKDKYPELLWSDKCRLGTRVKVTDVRDLVLYVLADGTGPQWISVSHRANVKKMVVVMVPGFEETMFDPDTDLAAYESAAGVAARKQTGDPTESYPRPLATAQLPEALRPLADMFSHVWPIRAPGDDRGLRMYSPAMHFLTAPAPKHKEKGGVVAGAKEPSGWKNSPTRITELLASRDELVEGDFKLHPAFGPDKDGRPPKELEPGWVATRVASLDDGAVPEAEIEHGSLTAGRQVLAIDCEMCMTGADEYSLTRISIVDWSGTVVMDELVKPDKPIIDHVTQFSGITAEMLAPVTTTLADVQGKLLDLVTPRTILLGHSLDSDLKAMKLAHPFIGDTTMMYPHPRGLPLRQSLKYLSTKYLSREIQKGHGAAGHDSVEDARACLDLVRQKCEKGALWGVADTQGESIFRRLGRAGLSAGNAVRAAADVGQNVGAAQEATAATGTAGAVSQSAQPVVPTPELGRTSAAVEWGDLSKGLASTATHRIGCESDDDVVAGVVRAVLGDADGREVRVGGVDFVWARMRELENQRAWSKPGAQGPSPAAIVAAADMSKKSADTVIDSPMGTVVIRDSSNSSSSSRPTLESHLRTTTARLRKMYDALPPCTAFIVLSGSGDPREMARLQGLQATARKEFKSGVKWDELSVKWTDDMEQSLIRAVRQAKAGVGFMTIK